jgi:hypothetical protein
MMIICLSPSEEDFLQEADALAKRYGEKSAGYNKDYFNELGGDERITLLGHGNLEAFGDNRLTAKMLVADLISFGLPSSVKCIDLIGCGIGEVVQGKSFVRDFVDELHAKGYGNLQVCAFTNIYFEESIAEIIVYSSPSGDELYVHGLTAESKQEYDTQLAQSPLPALKAEVDKVLDEKVSLSASIRDALLEKQNVATAENIKQLKAHLALITDKYKTLHAAYNETRIATIDKLHEKLAHCFYSGNDIRRTLDNNPNFQHRYDILKQLSLVSVERQAAWIALNTYMADFKEDLFNAINSAMTRRAISLLFRFSMPESRQELEGKIAAFTTLTNVIKTPELPIESVYTELHKLLQNPALRHLDVTQYILSIFSMNEEKLSFYARANKTISI